MRKAIRGTAHSFQSDTDQRYLPLGSARLKLTVWRSSNLDMRHVRVEEDILWHDVGKFTRTATRFNQSHDKQSAFAVQTLEDVRRKDALSHPIHVEGFDTLKLGLRKAHISKRVLPFLLTNMLKVFAVKFSQTAEVFIARAAAHGFAAIGGMDSVLPKLTHGVSMITRNLAHIEVAIDFDKVGHGAALNF